MAPNLATVCAAFPDMTFVIDHLAHNGNSEGGDLETWGAAIEELGKLGNVYAKMGAVEEWGVTNPEDYMAKAIEAFGFR
jgi:predicted TIM-barrel fold metal-dependent hydrolase